MVSVVDVEVDVDVDVDVRQRVSKTFCGRATPRLGVQTINVHVLITVTSKLISNSNTCKLVELVHLWQFSPIHVFLSQQTADIDY